jgi:hypothetical protein
VPDGLKQPHRGPDAMFAPDLPPTRGQLETIARLACELHNVPLGSRLDATTAVVRFTEALAEKNERGERGEDPEF